MVTRHVVLLNQSSLTISPAELTAVATALQTQVQHDFGPEWGQHAQVRALAAGAAVPSGAWPIRILDHPQAGLGVHLDQNHHPYAEIQAGADWSITASHELLEMLEDPYGQKFVQGPDIDPASDGHLVSYLVEVCDPCETFAYQINGIAVSDFVTQDYYQANASGVKVDFLSKLAQPYDVPRGGYISWQDPEDNRWHQKTPDGQFITARTQIDRFRNPRDDRDQAFSSNRAQGQHDLRALFATYATTIAPARPPQPPNAGGSTLD
jgi:hypothetical protein